MAEQTPGAPTMHGTRALVTFALGVLHTVTLLVVLGWPVYRGGALGEALAGVGTLPGLGLFALLWIMIGLLTLGATRGLDFAGVTPQKVFERGVTWGGFTGLGLFALVFVPALVLGAVATITEGERGQLWQLAAVVGLYGTFGAAVSFAVGAGVGFAFALLDGALLAASRRLVPSRGEDLSGADDGGGGSVRGAC